MKQAISLLLCALLLLGVFAGCSQPGQSPETTVPAPDTTAAPDTASAPDTESAPGDETEYTLAPEPGTNQLTFYWRADGVDYDRCDMWIWYPNAEGHGSSDLYGAALVIKHEGRITILITGQKNEFQLANFKTFMYYKIIDEYKKAGYYFVDMNGITGDFTDNNPYKELNAFKLKFKPTVYEYIGEFDLIINKPIHQILWSTNKIQKEFYK